MLGPMVLFHSPRVRIFTRKNRTATFKTPTAAGIAPDRHFVPDERKAGGAYVTVTDRVRHISVSEKVLVMEDGVDIALEDIATISGFPFEI